MKRLITGLMTAALALCLASCSVAQVDADVPATGSEAGSVREAVAEEEPAAEPEPEEPEVPEYDPVDLKRDNPLGDVEIAAVSLKLSGVGKYEITGEDAQTIKDMAQNDARIWQDSSEWTFFDAKYLTVTTYPYRIVVTLDSGEELPLYAYEVSGQSTNILVIGGEEYDLTPEEFDAFNAIHDRAYDAHVDQLDEAINPYADLSLDDLTKITRVRHYTEEDQSEQVLTDEQADMVLESLKNLEIDPTAAIFQPELLFGGGYECFMLWFKNGDSYYVGAYQGYGIWNEDYSEQIDSFPVAMIDGVLYPCDAGFAEDMYWDYEEFADYYVKRYMYGRDVPDYPFESMSDDEITGMYVGIDVDGSWVDRLVPLDSDLTADATDLLRSLLITDDNSLEWERTFNLDESVRRSSEIEISINGNESVDLGVSDGHVVINQGDYEEDADVVEALEDLIASAREAAEDLLAENGETQLVTASTDDSPDGTGTIKTYAFELPTALVKHDDGYYPDGYTLDSAPLSVQVNAYAVEMTLDEETYMTITTKPDDAIVNRVEEEMEAVDGEGYYDGWILIPGGSFRLVTRGDIGDTDREICLIESNLFVLEIDIVQRDDYGIGIDAVYSLIRETLTSAYG